MLDWERKKVALFIDNDYKGMTSFYSLVRDAYLSCQANDFVDTLSLYTLTPGVESSFANIRVCDDLCPRTAGSLEVNALMDGKKALDDPFRVFEKDQNAAMYELLNHAVLILLLVSLAFSI